MSIARLALRVATRKALMGRTWAEDRVYDSAITEIDQTVLDTRRPLIIVTTDDEERQIDGRDMLGAASDLDLILEIAVASFVRATDAAGVEMVIPDTDEALEVTVDLMCRQAITALQTSAGPWPNLWRRMVPTVKTVTQRRGADARNGIRFAARQISISLMALADPIKPPTEGDAFDEFLALAEADTELVPVARLIRGQLAGAPASWREAVAYLGLSDQEGEALGLAPLVPGEAPVPISAGQLGAGSGYVTQADIDQQLPEPPDA